MCSYTLFKSCRFGLTLLSTFHIYPIKMDFHVIASVVQCFISICVCFLNVADGLCEMKNMRHRNHFNQVRLVFAGSDMYTCSHKTHYDYLHFLCYALFLLLCVYVNVTVDSVCVDFSPFFFLFSTYQLWKTFLLMKTCTALICF